MKHSALENAAVYRPVPMLTLASALAMASIFSTVSPVMTHAQAATSPIAEAKLPAGADALDTDDLRRSIGKFLRAVASEKKVDPGSKDAAELFFWTGANYKSGHPSFWRASFGKALQAAGYNYREFDSHDVATNIYEQQYGLNTNDYAEEAGRLITLEMDDTQNYFIATHPETGATFIGLWLDQKNSKHCLLAIEQLGTIAPLSAAALPAVSGANMLLAKDPHNVMKGIVPPKSPSFAAMSAKPRTMRGMAKTAVGKPLTGATISVKVSAIGGTFTRVNGKTNAQGVYEIPLPVGVCEVEAGFCNVSYNGSSYFLPLQAADETFDTFKAAQGHVENFVLRTWGIADADNLAKYPKTGESYYGAPIRLQWFQDELPESGTMEVTLKPNGPLIDGTTGRTLVVRFPAKEGTSSMGDQFINNVPVGRYTMTARVLDRGEAMPMRMETVYDKKPLVASYPVDFKTRTTDYAFPKRSGIERFDLVLKP